MDKKLSDYTGQGENYRKFRKGYSEKVLDLLMSGAGLKRGDLVADLGAGTGIWSNQLANRGLLVDAVEPNSDMLNNGKIYTQNSGNVLWSQGFAENTNLSGNKYKLVTMASSFHWTDPSKSLPEFHRLLGDKGYVCLLWNPLVKENDEIQAGIESIIQNNLGNFKREFRTGEDSRKILSGSGLFDEPIEIRHIHYERVSKEDYLSAWTAANHFRKVAEEKGVFDKTMAEMGQFLKGREYLDVPYETRSWIARKKNGI